MEGLVVISRLLKILNKKKINSYALQVSIQLKMRNKNVDFFTQSQVAESLRVTGLGSGQISNVKKERYAYAMFCSEKAFYTFLPKYDYLKMREEIVKALFLNKNKKTFKLTCLLQLANYKEPLESIDLVVPNNYVSELNSSSDSSGD